jgi:uncharacterized DUF497 family protein
MDDDEFEWDTRKAKRNDREHGVTFAIARLVFDDLNASYVQRGHRKRIISARNASYREQDDYNEVNPP